MPTYKYLVQDKEGRLVRGVPKKRLIEAPTFTQKLKKLQLGFRRETRRGKRRGLFEFLFAGKVSLKDLVIFSRQFVTLFKSGVPLPRTLDALTEQTENRALRNAVVDVRTEVGSGASLADSMSKHPKVFPFTYTTLVRAGETAGILDTVLERLALQYEKEKELRDKIITAFAYPVVVLLVASGVVTFLIVYVIPMFEKVYSSVNVALPLPTIIVLSISNFVRRYWFLFPIFFFSLIYGIKIFGQTKIGREVVDNIKLRFPIFGDILHKACLTRFTRTFSASIGSGLSIVPSLEIVGNVSGNEIMNNAVRRMIKRIQAGESLSLIMRGDPIFPPILVRMVGVGEETGEIEEMFSKVAEFYESEIDHSIKRLTAMLEPVLVLIIGGIVGLIAVAMYLPIFNLGKVIK